MFDKITFVDINISGKKVFTKIVSIKKQACCSTKKNYADTDKINTVAHDEIS
jgi:hypothetical protein